MNEIKYTGLEVAVIGLACRFPGADNWRTYWDNLVQGRDLADRSFSTTNQHTNGRRDNFVRARVVLENKQFFDADFFDYRPVEAGLMNPLHRIFHACVWEALEDAGYASNHSNFLTGLFAGGNENLNWKLYSLLKNDNAAVDAYTLDYLNSRDYLSSLVAYKLNLRGPVVSVNTACSTSLVTVNMAYKSLLLGETDIALAGGISLVTQEQNGYHFEEGMIASKDGYCRAFDKDASGTIRGEGGGIVVLKRLQDAIRDRDNIYAIIKGTAINNDGKQKAGFTAPAVDGQATCIQRALKFSKVQPDTISYIETHGTGTRLGDVIEIEALNKVFRNNTNHRCAIGSVKTNMGHLDTAAGIAGLIKTILSLKNKMIPASLHFVTANPEIAFKEGPFYVNTQLTDWHAIDGKPLRAGVSSFGIGGTNAHVVLEEAPLQDETPYGHACHLLTISARNENSLGKYRQKLKAFLAKEPETPLNDLCYTMREGRRDFEYRQSFVFNTKENLLSLLEASYASGKQKPVSGIPPAVVFLFPGQGSQYVNMGRGLYEANFFFREQMDKGFAELEKLTGENFRKILYPDGAGDDKINNTRYTQPLLFLFEYSLARLLMASGITPAYLTGHSIGEYTAAAISGVFDFTDALKIVNRRAEILSSVESGAMLSAVMREEAALPFQHDTVSLAAINGPDQVVFSGPHSSIHQLAEKLEEQGVPHTLLKVSHAFHSGMLDGVLSKFAEVFNEVKMNPPSIPFISNITGHFIEPAEAATPAYWVVHLRNTVRFFDGIKHICALNNATTFVEAGPGKILSNMIAGYQLPQCTDKPLHLVRNIYNAENDFNYFLQQAGKLWEAGLKPDWSYILSEKKGRRISLPTYAFDEAHFVTEVPSPDEQAEMIRAGHLAQRDTDTMMQGLHYPSWSLCLNAREASAQRQFLFFSNGDAIAEMLVTGLKSSGHAVIEVCKGDSDSIAGKEKYFIKTGSETDYRDVYTDILNRGYIITDIIYAWAIPENSKCTDISDSADKIYTGVVYSIRNLKIFNGFTNGRFTLLTQSLHRVTGKENIRPEQSVALGLLPSLQQEYGLECRSVDFTEDIKEGDNAAVLLRELTNTDLPGSCTAIRFGQKWQRTFQSFDTGIDTQASGLKQGGLYLITGGLGNVGYCLSGYLLEKYNARLILAGRDTVARIQEKGLASVKNERLKKLSSYGERFQYCAVDMADAAAVEEMAAAVEKKSGLVDGIIHAAGITDSALFDFTDDMSLEHVNKLFAPKIKGIENIYKAYARRNPGFVWVTSSISSVTGGLGFGAYAAANACVDYFITAQFKNLASWTSVCLPELAFSENEIANMPMALKPDELFTLFSQTAGLGVSPVLYYTKRTLRATVVNKTNDLPQNRGIANGPDEKIKSKPRRLSGEYMKPLTETEKSMAAIFSEFFGIDLIGITDNFFDIGGDSLKGMILLKKINAAFDVKLQLADFLENPDIRSLSQKTDQLISLKPDDSKKFEIVV